MTILGDAEANRGNLNGNEHSILLLFFSGLFYRLDALREALWPREEAAFPDVAIVLPLDGFFCRGEAFPEALPEHRNEIYLTNFVRL